MNGPQRCGVKVVELVAPLPAGADQADLLEHVEVLRDGLPGQAQLGLRGESCAQLEQRLAISLGQRVQDVPASPRGECVEQVGHHSTIGK